MTTDGERRSTIPLRVNDVILREGEWPCNTDLLRRQEEIENLTPVLLNAKAPLVFAIDAPWGGGKTTFIRLWQHYLALESQNKVSLYLNAWESDFAEDPLLPMLSTLDDWLKTESDDSKARQAWESAKKYAPGILKSTAMAAAKAATFGALDLDKEFEKLASDLAGGAVGSIVDSFNVKQASLAQFKQKLEEALEALPDDQPNLIIFVDELDRCKPTYAIELLERIKHLFDIERIVFVLAVNRDQLAKSLQGVYGPSFDGSHYLRRFIDLDYSLKEPHNEQYINIQFRNSGLEQVLVSLGTSSGEIAAIKATLEWAAEKYGYRLRDIDQLIMRLQLIIRSIRPNHYRDSVVLLSLLILRQQNNALYRAFVADVNKVDAVIEFFCGGQFEDSNPSDTTSTIAGWLLSACFDEHNPEKHRAILAPWLSLRERLEQDNPVQRQLSTLLQIATREEVLRMRVNILKLAADRIELVEQISFGDE